MNETNLRRILVADDDSAIRFLTTRKLGNLCREMGFAEEVDSVSSGDGAVEMAKDTEYSLAVLDNSMELADAGFNAILKIKTFKPELPMILYTSSIDQDKQVVLRSLGAEVVIKNGRVELEDIARKYLEARK